MPSPNNNPNYRKHIILVPGFLTEKEGLDFGMHTAQSMECHRKRYWFRHFLDNQESIRANVHYYNWPSNSLHLLLEKVAPLITGLAGSSLTSSTIERIIASRLMPLVGPFALMPGGVLLARKLKPLVEAWPQAVRYADQQSAKLVDRINEMEGTVYVVGHSLGGRIAVRLLERQHTIRADQLFISAMAPAIAERETRIFPSNRNIKTEIFFSRNDLVLNAWYRLGEGTLEHALGYIGPQSNFNNGFTGIDVTSNDFRHSMGHFDYEEHVLGLLRVHSTFWHGFVCSDRE
ncbi:hypothetical protein [Geomonas sp. Red276]